MTEKRNPISWSLLTLAALACGGGLTAQNQTGRGQGQEQKPGQGIEQAGANFEQRLEAALGELSTLRETIAAEKLPMSRELSELEGQLSQLRSTGEELSRELVTKTDDLNRLTKQNEDLQAQANYLQSLLGDFGTGFDSRLHIAEKQLYEAPLSKARLALQNGTLDAGEKFAAQLQVVDVAIDKTEAVIGGQRFEGKAVADGVRKPGTFVLVGPTALFRAADGADTGLVQELPNSNEPTVVPFDDEKDLEAGAQLALGTGNRFPLDVTLGNAQKVASIDESWWEHVQKGGVIMIPMAILAGLALLVVLLKWLGMMFVRRPSKRQVQQLVDYVEGSDYASAAEFAESLPGPGGRMLEAGAKHLGEPRELIEEVMYEKMLTAKLKLNSWLPFVAICATSAPLLGLLGTVTGIMSTFALMTEFGAGDPKVLSSGISEALITTEHGLIIAIPSLLLHAFLSRKAKGIVDGMEKMALQFMNHVHMSQPVQDVREPAGVA